MPAVMGKLSRMLPTCNLDYAGGGWAWRERRLIGIRAIDEKKVIRVGRAAGVIQVTILITQIAAGKGGVNARIVVGVDISI